MMNLQKVAIHSVPRSGSSWLGQVFNSHPRVEFRFQPLFSRAFKDRLDENSSPEEIEKFFRGILISDDDFLLQKGGAKLSEEYRPFPKIAPPSHLIYKEVRYNHIIENLLSKDKEIRVVGIIRHPCAVINSWLKAPKEFRKDWDPVEEWYDAPKKNQGRKEEFNGFLKWREVAELFIRLHDKYPGRFYLSFYSDMIADPVSAVRALFNFVGLDYDKQTEDFVTRSTSTDGNDPYGVFKKKTIDDDWKMQLDPMIISGIFENLRNMESAPFLLSQMEKESV